MHEFGYRPFRNPLTIRVVNSLINKALPLSPPRPTSLSANVELWLSPLADYSLMNMSRKIGASACNVQRLTDVMHRKLNPLGEANIMGYNKVTQHIKLKEILQSYLRC